MFKGIAYWATDQLPTWWPHAVEFNRGQGPEGPKIDHFQSRLKNPISLEISILTFRIPTKERSVVGGSLEIFNLASKFQSRRAILKCFNLCALSEAIDHRALYRILVSCLFSRGLRHYSTIIARLRLWRGLGWGGWVMLPARGCEIGHSLSHTPRAQRLKNIPDRPPGVK